MSNQKFIDKMTGDLLWKSERIDFATFKAIPGITKVKLAKLHAVNLKAALKKIRNDLKLKEYLKLNE